LIKVLIVIIKAFKRKRNKKQLKNFLEQINNLKIKAKNELKKD